MFDFKFTLIHFALRIILSLRSLLSIPFVFIKALLTFKTVGIKSFFKALRTFAPSCRKEYIENTTFLNISFHEDISLSFSLIKTITKIIFYPFVLIDKFSMCIVHGTFFYSFLSKGMDEIDAEHRSDSITRKYCGGRNGYDMPLICHSFFFNIILDIIFIVILYYIFR